jgi:rubrerythrin
MPEFWGYQRFFREPVLETCDGGRWPVDVMQEHDDIKLFVEAFNAPSRKEAQAIIEKHCKREGMISRVLHTSVDEGIRMGIRNIDDVEVLEECLKREQGGDAPRVTLVKALLARIRKLEKLGTAKSKQAKEESTPEGVELVCVECGYEGTFVRPGKYERCPICSAVLMTPGVVDSFSLDDK